MVTYVYRDGKRLTPWMLYQINRLDTDLYRAFGVRVIVSDGIRTNPEQVAIFLSRYVTAGNVRGRRVYDTRWWNGQLWYRISAAGTVAQPGTSNHEIQGTNAAVDLRDTGSDAGITVRNSVRGRWIRENTHKYDLVAEGDGFNEGWHFLVRNIFNAVPSGGGSTPKSKEDRVIAYHREDPNARGAGRLLKPGGNFWLNTSKGAGVSKASNLVGGIGEYSITPHVYATGTPGDVLELVLAWDDTKTSGPHSYHYIERLVIDKDGRLNASREFKRGVSRGFAVYARLAAPSTNKGDVKVTLFDSDAYLFTSA